MVTTLYVSTEDMINKLENLKGKTKLKFYQNISNYYDEMNFRRQKGNFQFEEETFSKGVQSISKDYHDLLIFLKFLRTKPQVSSMIIIYYDSCYTVIKKRVEKEKL